MHHIKTNDWLRYKNIINTFIDKDAGKQPFLWLNRIPQIPGYGEDLGINYTVVQSEGLFHYNYVRTWANNRQRDSISGELDAGDTVLYISANLLNQGNYLDEFGYWKFDWAEDRFVINGKVYQPGGDTQVSQASHEALLFFLILQRVTPEENFKILNRKLSIGDSYHILTSENNKIITLDREIQLSDLIKPYNL